jgi:hypothetical protein
MQTIHPVTEKNISGLERQLTALMVLRPAIMLLIFASAIVQGRFSFVLLILSVLSVVFLVNSLQWKGKVLKVIQEQKPFKMSLYFSKVSGFSPFLDLKVTSYDPRKFDPLGQMFKPKWRLLSSTFDAKALLSGPQECLVYADRDSGRLYAIGTSLGTVFTRPYLAPWRKLELPSQSNQTADSVS